MTKAESLLGDQQIAVKSAHSGGGQAAVEGFWHHGWAGDMAIGEDDLGTVTVAEVGGGFGGVDVIEGLEHGVVGGGGRLEVVDLGGIGEKGEGRGLPGVGAVRGGVADPGSKVEVVAVPARGDGGLGFEERVGDLK